MPVRKACTEMLKHATRQQRYRLKKEYFDPHPLHLVTRTSPVPSMTDEQWNELVESWKDPKKMVCFFLQTDLAFYMLSRDCALHVFGLLM